MVIFLGNIREFGCDKPFLYETQNHKATKPEFNVAPSSARQGNANSNVFCWWADVGPFIAVFGSSIPSSTVKSYQIWTPYNKPFWICACLYKFCIILLLLLQLADLSDLDTHRDMFKHLPLYEAGLMELKHGSVSCRTLR